MLVAMARGSSQSLSMLRIMPSVCVRISAGEPIPARAMAWSSAARASMVIKAPGTPCPAQSTTPNRCFSPSLRYT